jgi:glycine cleavage system H protein
MSEGSPEDLVFQMGRYKAKIPGRLFYTKDHLWVEPCDIAMVGITSYRQRFFVDIQNVEFMVVPGTEMLPGTLMVKIEGVKAVAEILFGLEGVVTEINGELKVDPTLINSDTYEAGWLLKAQGVRGKLMSAKEYMLFLEADWKQTFERLVQERTKMLNIQ